MSSFDMDFDCSSEEIEDIGDVKTVKQELVDEEKVYIENAELVVIQHLDAHKTCLVCKARVEPCTSSLGECSKCHSIQKLKLCKQQMSSKLVVMSASESVLLLAFGQTLTDIYTQEKITTEALLDAPK